MKPSMIDRTRHARAGNIWNTSAINIYNMISVISMIYMTEIGKGKHIYGIVTVGERGQIVIPKEARDQFGIRPGDKLIVAGDVKKGIAIVKADILKELAVKILGAVSEENSRSVKEEIEKRYHSDEG